MLTFGTSPATELLTAKSGWVTLFEKGKRHDLGAQYLTLAGTLVQWLRTTIATWTVPPAKAELIKSWLAAHPVDMTLKDIGFFSVSFLTVKEIKRRPAWGSKRGEAKKEAKEKKEDKKVLLNTRPSLVLLQPWHAVLKLLGDDPLFTADLLVEPAPKGPLVRLLEGQK